MRDCDRLQKDKNILRAAMREKARLMKEGEVISASETIAGRLFSLPQMLDANIVFCYVSIEQEVQTYSIIEKLLDMGKKVCVPKCYRGGIMDARLISSLENLTPCSPFGILEPSDAAEMVDPAMIDFAIVPGLAFDRKGRRLGKGAGYYDRYLRSVKAVKCGVCFDEMLIDSVAVGAYDIPMDIVVTEDSIHFIEKMEGFDASTTENTATAV